MPDLKLEIDSDFDDILKGLAVGSTKAQVILKAVSTYKFLKEQTADKSKGLSVAIADSDGTVQKTIDLP
jgi:hypothetical protein